MNERTVTLWLKANSLASTPPTPFPLVDVQLDKWVFDGALGAHMLPFQSCFHNSKAQLHQPTLTKLYQTEPLIPLQQGESHPARPLHTNSFPSRCHTVSNLMEAPPSPTPEPCDLLKFS